MGRGKRSSARRPSPSFGAGLVAQGQKVCKQPFDLTPIAGYDLQETWAMKVEIEPPMVELIELIRTAYPHLAERLPVVSEDGSFAHYENEKARWHYFNHPDELRYEHESASEYVLNPAHRCFIHSIERKDGVMCNWYRYPNGQQRYTENDVELLTISAQPAGNVVHSADGWARLRNADGTPRAAEPAGPTDLGPEGTVEWRAVCYAKPVKLPDLHPLHRENGPAQVNPEDGSYAWYRKGKLHREGGPAVRHADGSVEFWRNGRQLEPAA